MTGHEKFFDASDFRKNFLTNKRGDMDRDEMEELRRMVQEEQYEGALRDRVRQADRANYEVALNLRSAYNAYVRAGFDEAQAFFLCVRNMELSIYLANNKSKPPK